MKLNSTLLLIAGILLLGFASCKKSNNSLFTVTSKVSGSTVTLSWTKVGAGSLQEYVIYRNTDTTGYTQPQMIMVDKNTTTYVDTLPLVPTVKYYVVATLAAQPGSVTSNTIKITRSDVNFANINPYDALYDPSSKLVYVYSNTGDIAAYDLQAKKWTKQVSLQSNIGYCDIGVYNGKTELYVPRSDGWLFIYDAATLTQTDQVNVGTQLYSVVYNNGILFVNGQMNTGYTMATVSYSRATKTKIGQTSASDNERLKLVPGTNSEFYGISSYSNLFYVKFDNSGNFLTQNNSYYYSSNTSDPRIFEVFPDGSNMITSSAGNIYSNTLTYVSTLPHGSNAFTCFCFDNTNSLIYAGCLARKIQAYSMSNYQLTNTISTQGYPVKVFYGNGSLIAVSTSAVNNYSYYGGSAYTSVEQFQP